MPLRFSKIIVYCVLYRKNIGSSARAVLGFVILCKKNCGRNEDYQIIALYIIYLLLRAFVSFCFVCAFDFYLAVQDA